MQLFTKMLPEPGGQHMHLRGLFRYQLDWALSSSLAYCLKKKKISYTKFVTFLKSNAMFLKLIDTLACIRVVFILLLVNVQ